MSAITSSLFVPRYNTTPPAAQQPPAASNPPAAQPQDDDDKKDITIGQAVTGLASAVVVAGIETVGNTASSILRAPQATYYAYKALWNTEKLGPVLKTTVGVMLPVATLAAPVLTALGSAGFGLFRGFSEGVEHGMGEAIKAGAKDVKFFHNEMAGKLIEAMAEYETEKLQPGEQPYEIKIIEGGKALVGGTVAGAVDGVAVGAITLARTPRGVYKALKEIWKSDQGPVLKTTETLLVPLAAALATPLATVGGAVYGFAVGAKAGYTEGLTASVKRAGDVVVDYEKATRELLKDD